MESQEEKAASLALSALQTIMASPIVFLVSGLSWAILKHFPVAVHKKNKIFSSKKLLAYNIMFCKHNELEPGQNLGPLVIPPAEDSGAASSARSLQPPFPVLKLQNWHWSSFWHSFWQLAGSLVVRGDDCMWVPG